MFCRGQTGSSGTKRQSRVDTKFRWGQQFKIFKAQLGVMCRFLYHTLAVLALLATIIKYKMMNPDNDCGNCIFKAGKMTI